MIFDQQDVIAGFPLGLDRLSRIGMLRQKIIAQKRPPRIARMLGKAGACPPELGVTQAIGAIREIIGLLLSSNMELGACRGRASRQQSSV
jgi:hypothetical protein